MAQIQIPKSLTKFVGGSTNLILDCKQLNELGHCLQSSYPDFYTTVYDTVHCPKKFVCFYLNSTLIKDFTSSIVINDQDIIEILIAISGG